MRILVIAGSYTQARDYMRGLGLGSDRVCHVVPPGLTISWHYIADEQMLRGTRYDGETELYWVGTWQSRPDLYDLELTAKVLGYPV